MDVIHRHPRGFFRALSHSLFLDNARFGLALLALLWAFDRPLAICGTLAAVIGHFRSERDTKLVTANCFFFGLGMGSLFLPSASFYFSLIVGALLLPIATRALVKILRQWRLDPLLFPSIIATWVFWLCGRGAGFISRPGPLPAELIELPPLHPDWSFTARFFWSACESAGRIFFLPSGRFGLALLLLTAAFSPRRGFFLFLATLVAALTTYFLATHAYVWEYGAFSASAGLFALAALSQKFGARRILVFSVFSAFLALASEEFLKGIGLPPLVLPYVLTAWLAILSRVPSFAHLRRLRWASLREGA
jgi:urea transporter